MKRCFGIFLSIGIVLMVLFIGGVNSATYYADYSTGNNSAVGSYALPWKTIGPHLYGGPNIMSNNDILILKNGTYYEVPNALNGLYTTRSNITIRGENKSGALVRLDNSSFLHGFYPDDGGVNLIGFNLTTNQSAMPCIDIRDASINMTIENMTIYNCHFAVQTYPSSGQPNNITIKNNIFFGNNYTLNFPNRAFINSSFYNNSLNDTYFSVYNISVSNFGVNQLDVKDNNISGNFLVYSEEITEIVNQNNFNLSTLRILNSNFSSFFYFFKFII